MYNYSQYFINRCIQNGISGYILSLLIIYSKNENAIHNIPLLILFLAAATVWFSYGMTMRKMLKEKLLRTPEIIHDQTDEGSNYKKIHLIFSLYLIVFLTSSILKWKYANEAAELFFIIYLLWFIREIQKVWVYLKS